MKKLVSFMIFFTILIFSLNTQIKADTKIDNCIYTHPEHSACNMVMERARILNSDGKQSNPDIWKKNILSNTEECIPDKIIAMDIGNDKNFDKKFKELFAEKKDCPDLYIDKDTVTCTKNNNINKTGKASQSNVKGKCYALYTENAKGRVKAVTESKLNLSQKEAADLENNKTNDTRRPTKEVKELQGIQLGKTYTECKQLITGKTLELIKKIFLVIKIIPPFLLIVLTMLDFAKVVAGGHNDELNKATSKFIKRSIITIAIFLLPTIILFLMNITGISDGTCGLK